MNLSIDENQVLQIYLHNCTDAKSIKVSDTLIDRATAKREIIIGNIAITMFERATGDAGVL